MTRARPLHALAVIAIGPILLAVAAMLSAAGPARAQEQSLPPQVVSVGVYVSPPFVMGEEGSYSGMAIELWERIAARLHVVSDYKKFDNYTDLVKAVADGTVQAAVTNLSVTAKRAEMVDFTYPWFDDGLRIMVDSTPKSSLSEIVDDLSDAGHLMNYAWLALSLLLATTLLTLFDRRFDSGFPKRWRDGLAESLFHVVSIATTGRSVRKNLLGWFGRVWQAGWMVCGIAIVAYVTSSITSVMTVAQITNEINSAGDLHGRTVGVRRGSVSEEYMQATLVDTKPFNQLKEAVDALFADEIAAIAGDSSVLEYYAHSHPDLKLDVVGSAFRPSKYGFAFSPGSPLTKPASMAVIAMQDSGEIEKMRARYFGTHP